MESVQTSTLEKESDSWVPSAYEIAESNAGQLPMDVSVVPADKTRPCFIQQCTRSTFDGNQIVGGFLLHFRESGERFRLRLRG